MKVNLFIPCFIDQLYPSTAFSTIKILEKAGCEVLYNEHQTCCGQPAYNSGYWNEATKLADKFLKDFPQEDICIVSPSASCISFVKNHYRKLFEGQPEKQQECERVSKLGYELSDFLVNVLRKVDLGASFHHKVTFHDSCSALREYGIKSEPRALLSKVKGLELIEMEESETCCGFGGTFSVKHTSISSAMTEKKVENALKTGASYIISTEASCLMSINGYCKKHDLPIKGIHLADVISNFE
jgi:L-lactate dehydrogenase complex protein LldE